MDMSGSPPTSLAADWNSAPYADAIPVSPASAPEPVTEIRFRSFRLFPGARLLLRGGRPVDLGSRAFDLLHVLAASRGYVVDKSEILDRVWPRTTVEESNLRFQVAVLRRALGDDRDLIKTVAGRGYQLADEGASGWEAALPGLVASGSSPRPAAVAPEEAPRSFAVGQAALDALSLAPSAQACEALCGLLRTVLDELWAMTGSDQVTRRPTGQA